MSLREGVITLDVTPDPEGIVKALKQALGMSEEG